MSEMLTAGIDVGSAAVKVALLADREHGEATLLSCISERIRRRDPVPVPVVVRVARKVVAQVPAPVAEEEAPAPAPAEPAAEAEPEAEAEEDISLEAILEDLKRREGRTE